jgi:hypothetical protein
MFQIFNLDTPSNSIVIQPNEYKPWYTSETTVSPSNIHTSVPDKVTAFPATADYITKAKETVEKMSANGGKILEKFYLKYFNNVKLF